MRKSEDSTNPVPESLSALKEKVREAEAFLVGIVGFSGSWSQNRRPDAERTTHRVIRHLFGRLEHARAWCVSGATNFGVPAVAYQVAEELDLRKVGLTARQALRYPLAELDHLVLVGERFGDESDAFVELCDVFWIIGGGAQSEQEMRLASEREKPILVVQGLGGAADRLTPVDLPNARFVPCDTLLD